MTTKRNTEVEKYRNLKRFLMKLMVEAISHNVKPSAKKMNYQKQLKPLISEIELH